MTRGSLESVGDVEAEVEAQCATLCRRIGDEVAKSACYMMAGLIGDLMKVRQRRMMMQHHRNECLLPVIVHVVSCTVVEVLE